MKIEIAKKDLFGLRAALDVARKHIALLPSSSERIVLEDAHAVAGKVIRKINSAIKKVHGHDWGGSHFLDPYWELSAVDAHRKIQAEIKRRLNKGVE